ncbi:nucleoside monophosphate kinase [Candidatus Parcubacteria bacterium]|nr:nucleoside monophosphate kinase [Candidatus Parcubacteria bacterium]
MAINTFIFMGRPGAGKGVQSALLSEEMGFPIFSTGDKVRSIAKAEHTLGKKVKEVSESGGLTPHWFASFLFQEALFAKGEGEGIIFEGVGRKEPEAKLFAEINEWLDNDFRVLYLNASEETITKRLIKRGELEGRADDTPEKIKVRLENFNKETQPALEYLRSIGKVIDIDGEPLPDAVHAEVMEKLKPLL